MHSFVSKLAQFPNEIIGGGSERHVDGSKLKLFGAILQKRALVFNYV